MKNSLKYLVSNLLLIGLTSTMFLATGCPAEEDSCTTNEDCTTEGEICDAGTNACVAKVETCADDSACTTEGEYCLGEGDSKTCRQPTDCAEVADAATYCAGKIEGFDAATQLASCSDAKVCEAKTKKVYQYVQIADTSKDGACTSSTNGKKDPGSDIMGIALLSADGNTVAFAKTVVYNKGADDNDFTDADAVFTGTAPATGFFDENGVCPSAVGDTGKFRTDSVLSLGCLGELFVEFHDADGKVMLIDPSKHSVLVTEYGPYCNDTSTDPTMGDPNFGTDRFSAFMCITDAGATTVTSAECAGDPLGSTEDKGYESYDLSTLSLPDPNE